MFGVPRGIRARWDEVFAAAAEHRTAIEINAYPDRQDLDLTLAGPAAGAGCLISLGTEATPFAILRGWTSPWRTSSTAGSRASGSSTTGAPLI